MVQGRKRKDWGDIRKRVVGALVWGLNKKDRQYKCRSFVVDTLSGGGGGKRWFI